MEVDSEVVGLMPVSDLPGFLQLTIREILEEDDESEPECVNTLVHFSQIIIDWNEESVGISIGDNPMACDLSLEAVKEAIREAIRR